VAVASFLAAVLTEIYLCNVCSGQEILRRNGRGQRARHLQLTASLKREHASAIKASSATMLALAFPNSETSGGLAGEAKQNNTPPHAPRHAVHMPWQLRRPCWLGPPRPSQKA
jgi:hypothetical protein